MKRLLSPTIVVFLFLASFATVSPAEEAVSYTALVSAVKGGAVKCSIQFRSPFVASINLERTNKQIKGISVTAGLEFERTGSTSSRVVVKNKNIRFYDNDKAFELLDVAGLGDGTFGGRNGESLKLSTYGRIKDSYIRNVCSKVSESKLFSPAVAQVAIWLKVKNPDFAKIASLSSVRAIRTISDSAMCRGAYLAEKLGINLAEKKAIKHIPTLLAAIMDDMRSVQDWGRRKLNAAGYTGGSPAAIAEGIFASDEKSTLKSAANALVFWKRFTPLKNYILDNSKDYRSRITVLEAYCKPKKANYKKEMEFLTVVLENDYSIFIRTVQKRVITWPDTVERIKVCSKYLKMGRDISQGDTNVSGARYLLSGAIRKSRLKEAIPPMIALLKDEPHWGIRAGCAQELVKRNARNAIPAFNEAIKEAPSAQRKKEFQELLNKLKSGKGGSTSSTPPPSGTKKKKKSLLDRIKEKD